MIVPKRGRNRWTPNSRVALVICRVPAGKSGRHGGEISARAKALNEVLVQHTGRQLIQSQKPHGTMAAAGGHHGL
jgi:hypothetical protein